MKLFNDEALVLQRRPWAEQDMLITLFTKHHGKMTVVAKGVRSIRSSRGGHVDLFNVVKVHIKEGKGFPLLSEVRVIEDFSSIKEDWQRLSFFYYVVELLVSLFYDEEAHPEIYDRTVAVLRSIAGNNDTRYDNIVLRDYEINLLRELGYWSDDQYRPLYPRVLLQQRRFNQSLLEEVAGKRFKTLSLLS